MEQGVPTSVLTLTFMYDLGDFLDVSELHLSFIEKQKYFSSELGEN